MSASRPVALRLLTSGVGGSVKFIDVLPRNGIFPPTTTSPPDSEVLSGRLNGAGLMLR